MPNTKIKTRDHDQVLVDLIDSLRSDIHSLGARTLVLTIFLGRSRLQKSLLVGDKSTSEDKKHIAIFSGMILSFLSLAIYFIYGIFSPGTNDWVNSDYEFFTNVLLTGIAGIILTFLVLLSISFRSVFEFYNRNRGSLAKILSYWLMNSFDPKKDILIGPNTMLFMLKKQELFKSDLRVIFATLSILNFGLLRVKDIEITKAQDVVRCLACSEMD